jgi:hypothetical protein
MMMMTKTRVGIMPHWERKDYNKYILCIESKVKCKVDDGSSMHLFNNKGGWILSLKV